MKHKEIIITISIVVVAIAAVFAAYSLYNSNCCSPATPGTSGSASAGSDSAVTAPGDAASNTEGAGILSSFQAVDIDGNAVDQTVFSGKKLTMVNIWATYCGPCIREMPDLAELSAEYADQGVQIIGIPIDVTDRAGNPSEPGVEVAKEVITKTGANYLHILPSPSLISAKLSEVSSVPETIFVDENGNQVGKSYSGSRSKAKWQAIIVELLGQVS